ncbi:MAG: DNA-binding response regulator [Bacteroidetes bacterium RIFOXYA12_FULL_35_11]|nr:MAG: DNA-binding response regulator [Bacteroidetes bacterium GWF2_35_48]OFY75306.1 MAG: DNA-binding response regulator [Bacteroidetes bacterium RIFOXYA12_FULL_35_11]OFY95854.1 MAG: DNA-binding response regulator [Bacteroidetes bacterium RIFOXYB2_FULL_35_7]OFY98430.1 MAG: DNA-binding response regulator [Bacteroidetes bacterium RIFOXYC12_FULL_35_7]
MKILIIEDEQELRKSIKQYLYQEGYIVESASDFPIGSEKVNDFDYDCVLIDITLPGGNGLEIIKQLKESNSKAGIIIISAKNSLTDKITGLDLGADDYLPKPFHLSELNSRIKALLRRKNFEGSKTIIFNEITIIPEERKVKVNNNEIDLTAKEYDLLLFLIVNKNKVVSKNAIAENLSGDFASFSNSHDFIYTHLKNLRKKLEEQGCKDYIQSIYGIGYSFKTL